MTKDRNLGFFIVSFLAGGGGCRTGHGKGRCWLGVFGAIIFICDTLYQPNTHCFKFASRYSIGTPSYGLHKNSFGNLAKGCISNSEKTV